MRLPLPARLGGLAAVLCADRFHVHADNASYRARLSLLADRARLEEAVSLRASSLHAAPPAPGVAVLPPTYYKLGPGKTCPFANPPATLNSAEECQFAATRLGVNRDAGAVH
eukprot:g14227.t1